MSLAPRRAGVGPQPSTFSLQPSTSSINLKSQRQPSPNAPALHPSSVDLNTSGQRTVPFQLAQCQFTMHGVVVRRSITVRSRNKVRRPLCDHHPALPLAEFFFEIRSENGRSANSRWNQRANCGTATTRSSGVDELSKPSRDKNAATLTGTASSRCIWYLHNIQHQTYW